MLIWLQIFAWLLLNGEKIVDLVKRFIALIWGLPAERRRYYRDQLWEMKKRNDIVAAQVLMEQALATEQPR